MQNVLIAPDTQIAAIIITMSLFSTVNIFSVIRNKKVPQHSSLYYINFQRFIENQFMEPVGLHSGILAHCELEQVPKFLK